MTRFVMVAALLALAAPAAAQTPLLPGQVIQFDIATTGQQQAGSTVVLRPEANVAFEYRIDGAATPVPAVKSSACTVTTAPAMTCKLVPPTLSSGTHTIEVRSLPSPAEVGVSPSAYSSPLSVAVIIVTSPGTPSAVRVASVP